MLEILLSSAGTGAGKTESCLNVIIRLLNDGENVILVQPTKALNKQTLASIINRNAKARVTVFNHDTVGDGASFKLAEHLRQPPDYPHIIITTNESFDRLPFVSNRKRYHLIFDEIPNAFRCESITIPHNHHLITNALELIPQGASYNRVLINDITQVRRIAENKTKDAIYNVLRPLALKLQDKNYNSYVNGQSYGNLKRGASEDRDLTIFFLRSPTV